MAVKRQKDKQYRRLMINNFLSGLISVLIICFFFAAHLWFDYQSYEDRELDKLRVLTVSAASQTENLIDSILITMKLLDAWIIDNPDRDPRFDPEFNKMVDVFRAHTNNTIDLRMATEDGGLFYFPSKNMVPLADVSDREYYLAQKNNSLAGLYFAAPVISRVTGNWGVPISYKLTPNKHRILILFASVEFKVFDHMFSGIIAGTRRAYNIVREDHLVLERTPFDEFIVGKLLEYESNADGYDVMNINNPEPTKRIFFRQKLSDFPVYVLIADDYERIWVDWLGTVWIKLFVVIAIIIVFAVFNIRSMRLLKELNETKKMLETAARFDSLTKLKNRRYFFERATDEMERTIRHDSQMILLMADIDHFKVVNDTYGHPVGDEVLKKFAAVFESCVRINDVLGRVGGEEFAILLTETDLKEACEIADRIRVKALSVKMENWNGGLSIGVAKWKGSTESLASLYKRADDALFKAKEAGRNRICVDSEDDS